MASPSQILPEGDRYDNPEGNAFALFFSGIVYLVLACPLYFLGNVFWAEMLAIYGVINWALALMQAWLRRR
jgi:hypothetical protein